MKDNDMDCGSHFFNRLAKYALVIGCVATVISCKTIKPKLPLAGTQSQQVIDQSIQIDKAHEHHYKGSSFANNNVPYSVSNALLPSISSYVKPAQPAQDRFDVTASNVPAKEFFMGLVSGTNNNMLVNPSINGNITIELKNVSIRQTLDAIKDMYGYDYARTSYGYEIFQPQIATKLFHLNYLDVQRTGNSYIQLTTGQVSNKVGSSSSGGNNSSSGSNNSPNSSGGGSPSGLGAISSIETKSEMKFWKDIEKAITSMVGNDAGHNVTVNALSGVISVRAYPAELKNIERYVNSLQTSLNRQVILEAKILEVQLDDSFQAGIDWSVLGNPAAPFIDPITGAINKAAGLGQDGTKIFTDPESNTNLDAITGIFAIRVNGNFKALIHLLQSQGNVQVLSSPHISTVNNQKAVIKVGSDEFFVTGVSTTNSVVGNNTLPSQDVTLTPFFSGITLDVTPEISSDSTVVLHIHPSISRVTQQNKRIGLGQTAPGTDNTLNLPLAYSTIRESDNVVRAKDGQIIVIGGLMTNVSREEVIETPGVSRIPFLGSLFRRTRQTSAKSELVILLRPIVATNKNYISALETEKRQFKILKRPFHAGGLPHVFGNEAERNPD
jgi:MSHA biogenesis protein MshL